MAIAGGGVSSKLASASVGHRRKYASRSTRTAVHPASQLRAMVKWRSKSTWRSAINNPSQRPIIQPGDTLILQFKPCEEAINFGVGTFFTYGITQLFNS